MKITVPTSLSEMTLRQWQNYHRVIKESQEPAFVQLALVTIFCNITVAEAKSISSKDLKETADQIAAVLNEPARHIQRFVKDGVEYGFIPNLDGMSAGEYIDLDDKFTEEEELHNAMAILYRPIIQGKTFKNLYQIEPYESAEKYSDIMKECPLSVALGAKVFFYNLGSELLNATIHFIQQPTPEAEEMKAGLMKSGVGTAQFIQLLTESRQDLKRLLNLTSTSL